jgi:hypothetical protein
MLQKCKFFANEGQEEQEIPTTILKRWNPKGLFQKLLTMVSRPEPISGLIQDPRILIISVL